MPDQDKHYFLTVLIADKFLQSSLVSNNGQGVQTKEFSEIKSYLDRQDLIDQLDKSLQQLGSESQDVVETIFAFDNDWLENGELSDLKKPIVKEISEELSLDAIGQISIPEALAEARLIGDQSDSCLLLVFKEDSLDLIFIKHGQFLDLITVGRSGNVVDDFTEILGRASRHLDQEGKYFPSKVLMTSIALKQKEVESLHAQLVEIDWTANPGFSQAPSIVALESDYMIKSVSLSAGKVLSKENLLAKMPKREVESRQPMSVEVTQRAEAKPTANVVPVGDQSNEYAVERSASSPREGAVERSASSFGINFDQNYFAKKEAQVGGSASEHSGHSLSSSAHASDTPSYNSVVNLGRKQRSEFGRFYLSHKKMVLLGFGTGLLALLLIASIFAFFVSKVKIILTPEQTLLQKSVTITLDPNVESSDFSKALLKASLQNKEVSGQDVSATTGIGLVGEKAKGKIVIYNKTSQETELKQGIAVSNNGIEFLLDSTVKIPAAVVKQDDSGVDFGKTETTVTAKDIGSEANLNKETKLRVADYFEDKFSAATADNFSGGSSREVRVVAQADQSRLLETLSKKLMEEATKEFDQESEGGLYLVPTGKNKTIKSNFSAKIGDETESLTLDLTLDVEAVKYLSTDLKKLGLALLEKDLPAGYSFVDQDPSLMSDKAQSASDSSRIKLSADLSAKAVANLNLEDLKKQVLGKDWSEAQDQLENNSEIKQASVIFNPPFLINILRKLPSDQSRIILELSK